MQVDIKFIARKAGVSPATVSRVLNGTKPVSKALQARVLEEVERYGYRPNSLARGLIQGKSSLIGVIVPNVSDLFHAKVISGIEAGANEHGYNVILSNIYTDMERQKRAFAILRERRVDGIILLHENTPRQMEEILPLVEVPLVLASVNVPGSCLPTVGIDDERAAYDTVSYLIRLGHRRIGGIFVSDSYTLNDLRRRGYLRAMAEHGLPVEERYMVTAACTMEEGEAAAEQLFRETPPPTALFCVADELALGAANYLLDRGYRLPEDVSITGFDDINLASVLRPKLTTIHQPMEEIGRRAAGMLLSLMKGTPLEQTHVVLPHRLIVRESCCPPREAL